ncbi:MAG: hypothetical protein M3548_03345 [Actinomycetota bacterium]|nr:hypothetical protein [Actinomycetota bacterium]
MSVDRLTARLRAVLTTLDQARLNIVVATTAVAAAAQACDTVLRGTADTEASQVPAALAGASQDVSASHDAITAVKTALRAYLINLGVTGQPDQTMKISHDRVGFAQSDGQAPSPTSRPGISNRHGDRYPENALPYSDSLPPRVLVGQYNSPTTCHVEVDGRAYGEVRATRNDVWTQEVVKYMSSLKLPAWARQYSNHVEMKAVMMLVMSNGKSACVVVNHAPCGSEAGVPIGCDILLPRVIPRGSSVTVLGTDAQGNPFERTYSGEVSP